MRRLKGLDYELMEHLSDATAIVTFSTPVRAVVDQVAGVSDMESIESRIKMAGLLYLGLARLIKLRDYTKKKLKLDKSSNKALHYLHDIAFTTAFSIPIQAGVYISSGVTDIKELAGSILGGLAIISVLSGPLGQYIDIYREMSRVKKSKNTPRFLKKLRNSTKKKVAVGLIAGSLALTGILYSAIPNRDPDVYNQTSTIDKVLEQEDILYSEKILGGEDD